VNTALPAAALVLEALDDEDDDGGTGDEELPPGTTA
jgi:hypothetical protein